MNVLKKLRKYDLPFLKQSAGPYAACIVICVSSEKKQHLEAAGTVINGGQYARVCQLDVKNGEEQNMQDWKHWKQVLDVFSKTLYVVEVFFILLFLTYNLLPRD